MAGLQDSVMMVASTENLAIGASSVQSSPIVGTGNNAAYEIVRVAVTVDAYLEIGPNPTATSTTSHYWPAGQVEYLRVNINDRIAFIQSAAGGRITISRMA